MVGSGDPTARTPPSGENRRLVGDCSAAAARSASRAAGSDDVAVASPRPASRSTWRCTAGRRRIPRRRFRLRRARGGSPSPSGADATQRVAVPVERRAPSGDQSGSSWSSADGPSRCLRPLRMSETTRPCRRETRRRRRAPASTAIGAEDERDGVLVRRRGAARCRRAHHPSEPTRILWPAGSDECCATYAEPPPHRATRSGTPSADRPDAAREAAARRPHGDTAALERRGQAAVAATHRPPAALRARRTTCGPSSALAHDERALAVEADPVEDDVTAGGDEAARPQPLRDGRASRRETPREGSR